MCGAFWGVGPPPNYFVRLLLFATIMLHFWLFAPPMLVKPYSNSPINLLSSLISGIFFTLNLVPSSSSSNTSPEMLTIISLKFLAFSSRLFIFSCNEVTVSSWSASYACKVEQLVQCIQQKGTSKTMCTETMPAFWKKTWQEIHKISVHLSKFILAQVQLFLKGFVLLFAPAVSSQKWECLVTAWCPQWPFYVTMWQNVWYWLTLDNRGY